MSQPTVSRMAEDYLTLVWKAYEWPGDRPSTTDLAARLGVTASTVSANLKKLARDGFIDYEAYGSIELTDAGRAVAIDIVRRHRIIETYLVERLGLGWDQVHDEADRLEHAVSDLVLDAMDAELGHPTHDPHGDPIPRRADAASGPAADVADGRAADGPAAATLALTEAAAGMTGTIARVSDRRPEVLQDLDARGLAIGDVVEVVATSAALGTVTLVADGRRHDLGPVVAAAIRLARLTG